MSTRTPIPGIPLLEGYSQLQQPGNWMGLQRLIDQLSQLQRPGRPRLDVMADQIDGICRYLKQNKLVESVAVSFDKRLLDGSYAAAVLFCSKEIDGQRYPMAIIIRTGEWQDLSGICYVSLRDAPSPGWLSLSDFVDGLMPAFEHVQLVPA